MDDCYYLDATRNQQGPVPAGEIARLIRSGTIRSDTMVWYAGMPDWRPVGQVDGFASLFARAARPPAAPSPSAFAAASPMQRGALNAGAYPGQALQAQPRQYVSGKRMGFFGAVATCLRKYVDFKGRARRPEYWWWMLFYWVALIGLGTIDETFFRSRGGVLAGLAMLALALPTFAVTARRLHDTDRSGWLQLISLIPIAGLILIVYLCQRGTEGPNRFGSDDLALAAEFD